MTSRTVLITGGAHRIGAAITRDLHEHSMDVVIHYHQSLAEAEKLAEDLNGKRSDSAYLVHGDLMDFENYSEIIDQAYGFKNRLDVLINNASSFFPTPLGQISLQQWQNLIGVNMQAPLFLAQLAADHLAANKGCIINLTDIHAIRPMKDFPVYSSAKAGLEMLTKALARELGSDIRVNGLSLGAVLWPENMNQEKKDDILKQTTLKRRGELIDVANAIRFLINDADYMTGQILTIDGGRTLYS